MNYAALVTDNTRASDNYVNATRWCAEFGKRFDDYFANKETKKRWKAIAELITANQRELKQAKRGANSDGIWIHPLCALHLAQWLSPEFHVHTLQVFKRFAEGDITLADDILQRASAEDAAWLEQRARGRVARATFTAELQKRGVGRAGFAQNTNAIYKGLFGDTAAGLKESLCVKNPRDGMSQTELAAVQFAELLAVDIMDKRNAHGNAQTTRCSSIAGNHVGNALEQALDNY